jgi:hypothetical protein
MGGGGNDAREEPTEIAPRGLPLDGFLQATVSRDSIIRPNGPIAYALGPDELAMMEMLKTGPMAEAMAGQPMPESGRLGSRTLWDLRGYVAPNAYVGSTLSDDQLAKNATTVSLSSLPANVQAEVAARLERLKKSPLGAIMSLAGKKQ